MDFTGLIDVESLHRRLAAAPTAGAPVVLDCRFDLGAPDWGRKAYEAGHIPGAYHADLNRDLAAPASARSGRHPLPETDALRAFCGSVGITPEIQVIAYDDANGSFAARAWWLLRRLGIGRIAVLDGGFGAWRAAGGAVSADRPEGAPAAAPDALPPLQPLEPEPWTADRVLGVLADRSHLLVDARAPERFSGATEPLDPVAGHVPGAVNHPFTANLGVDGRFLPAAELRRRWLERLQGRAAADVILMCGSGVTACHNRLAMQVAGLPGAALYAGSWSEWIRDANRPVARADRHTA